MNIFLCVLLALALAGCQYDPHTSEYTATQSSPLPRTADLVGTYSPTQDTRALNANQGHYRSVSTSIILSKDGTFQFKNVPDWWNTDGGEFSRQIFHKRRAMVGDKASRLVGH